MSGNGQQNPPPPIRASLLGKVRISVGDRLIGDDVWSLRSARALFLLLLITPGHALPKERACDLLWPEASPDVGRNALYKALHLLRRVLEPDLASARESAYIESRGATIGFSAGVECEIDFEIWEREVRQAMLASGETRRGQLREAIGLYGGELLPTERYEDWPAARREGLQYAWEGAVLDLATLDLEAGEPQASVPSLELLLATDSTIEVAHRVLMQGYIAAGQRDRALRQYQRCVEALSSELGIEPDEETQALHASIAETRRPPAAPPPIVTGRLVSLPAPPTPIIGRDRETELLQGTLWRQDARLVTLLGPGGVGKTRLAIEAASHVIDDFADGVVYVPLATVGDPALMIQAIASALGLREEPGTPLVSSLQAFLQPRELLLVLDNLEQVLDAATDIGDLLASCPSLTVLATSRERLQLRGEHLQEVEPLAVPRAERLPAPALLERYGSVALFAQQMRQIDPEFEVTLENCEVVSAICRHLEGLPLAIELATAGARFFTLGGLLARLARRLEIEEGPRDLPPRQRTLRATFAWSHDLLTPEEQVVFRRLGGAVGGYTRDAATLVCGDDDGRLRARLHSLAEKHLIRLVETDEGPRVTMLETIREFAVERLRESGEEAGIQRRHADHFLGLATQAGPHLVGPAQIAWLERLETEQGNIRAALDWALDRDGDSGTLARRGAVALWRFWLRRRTLSEGIDWLERARAGAGATPDIHVRILVALARLYEAQSDYARAESLIAEALPAGRRLGDDGTVADALTVLGETAEDRGDLPRAASLYRQAQEIYRANALHRDSATSLSKLAAIAYYEGAFVDAMARWEESVAIYRELGDHWGTGVVLGNLGAAAMAAGDFRRAVALHEESLSIARLLKDQGTIGRALGNLAEARQACGDGDQDALLEEALGLHREASDRQSEISTLATLGQNALGRGDTRAAATRFAEDLALCRAIGDRSSLASTALLERVAALGLATDQRDHAARLIGASDALRQELGTPIPPYLRPVRDRCLDQLGAGAESGTFDRALLEGGAWSPREAIRAGLDICARAGASPAPPIDAVFPTTARSTAS